MSRSLDWWDNFYLIQAKSYAAASKDPSTKVGAIIIDLDKRIIATGYNGFPKGIKDTQERLNNREKKYSLIIHAEANCILHAKTSLENCTIFTWPFMPCSNCASMIIQSGIKRVVSLKDDNPRWLENFLLSKELFEEAGVELCLYDQLFPLQADQWKNIAMRFGELFSKTGPDGYYNFTPQQWYDWAKSQLALQ